MERKYYIVVNNEHEGPFSIEELKEIGITNNTLVWIEGNIDWLPAEEFNELKEIIKVVPPPIKRNGNQLIIKSEEPLKFEDNLKKIKIEKQDFSKRKFNKITAKEIKRIIKYLKYSILSFLFVFAISFALNGGFKYLYYYFDAKKYQLNYATQKIYNIKSWDNYKIDNYYSIDYNIWSKRLNKTFNLTEGYYNKIITSSNVSFLNQYNSDFFYQDYEYDDGLKIEAFTHYKYINVIGDVVERPKSGLLVGIVSNKSQYEKYKKFNSDLSNGLIKLVIEIKEINIRLHFGGIIKCELEDSLKNAFIYGLIVFLMIFPCLYLIGLIYKLYNNSKNWVEKNSNN